MRVLHLVGQAVDVGGVLSVIRNLQRATREFGVLHRVWVRSDYQERRHPPLAYISSPYAWDEPEGRFRLFVRTVMATRDLSRFLRNEPVEILHAHTRGGLMAGLGQLVKHGRPFLFTNHMYGRNRGLYRRVAALKKLHTVVLTPNMARYYGLPEHGPRLSVISACCGEDLFRKPLPRSVRTIPDSRLRLIGVGTLLRWKNWHLLTEAFSRLHASERARIDFHHWGETLDLAESRDYGAELLGFVAAQRLEGCVRFCGSTNRINEELARADWFVLPSTNEPCSVALLEALATGIPALASRSGGNVDLIQEGKTGLLFEPDCVDDLVRVLRRLLTGVPSLAGPGQIRDSVVSRSATAVGREYLNLYRRLVGQ